MAPYIRIFPYTLPKSRLKYTRSFFKPLIFQYDTTLLHCKTSHPLSLQPCSMEFVCYCIVIFYFAAMPDVIIVFVHMSYHTHSVTCSSANAQLPVLRVFF